MIRDMDLIRGILLEVEQKPLDGILSVGDLKIGNFSKDQIIHNARLLDERGFIKATFTYGDDTISGGFIESLTWEGYDFLDAARDEKLWNKATSMIKEKGGSFTVDLLKALLVSLAQKALSSSP